MKKIRNMLKKGGVADIVTLMIIVGLVIALIIAVVLPLIRTASESGDENDKRISGTQNFIDDLADGKTGSDLNYSDGTRGGLGR